ncbi:Mpo1 family 2-hydroxy fatty acid dioxygenase [Undibacterium fentianense]|uniref:DUF962 domain-containing protein n=1 Tax=Undibacterium fentianense TaxID=2828728 RepID=A0A941DYB6_9BURK|nr:Mpo1-like protein [Undibacterium fentianense]MBR7799000.1 DUF962 domain-containing protein [Undibacterium fentianense]
MTTVQESDPITSSTKEREVDRLLHHYAESHRNPINEKIHFLCVPTIMWTVLGLIWAIHPWAAFGGALLALVYYFSLSFNFAIGMALMASIMLAILQSIPPAYVLPSAGIVFVVAWIFQFIGHKIEGKKPSFFEDVRYLLIGPLFVLSFLYRRLHIRY